MKIAKITYPNVRPDMYVITDQGVILNALTGKPMSYYVDRDGYYHVSLMRTDRRCGHFPVHRLVAYQFCPNETPDITTTVNHKSGEKKYNFASNLEWVTSADNTKHAEETGLRHVRGSSNGNSKYDEAFVHMICQYYEDGLQPIEVFHKLYGNRTMKGQEDHTRYFFLYRLKKREIWPDIVAKYKYSPDVIKVKGNKIYDPSRTGSVYDENDIRWICECLEQGYWPAQIAHMARTEDHPNLQWCSHNRIRDLAQGIKSGRNWLNISAEYDFDPAVRDERNSILAEKFGKLLDAGLEDEDIILKVSRDTGFSMAYVTRHFKNFATFAELSGEPKQVVFGCA